MSIKNKPINIARHFSNTSIGEYPLNLVFNSKLAKVSAKSLESIKPSWHVNFVFELTDFLILIEQFQSLLKLSNSSVFNSLIQWTNELSSFAEEVRTEFLNNPAIMLDLRTADDEWPCQLDSLLVNSPSPIITEHDELENALNVMIDFWVQQISRVGWNLHGKILEPYSSRELDSRYGLILDKKHAPKPLPT